MVLITYSGIEENILSFQFSNATNIFSLVSTGAYDPSNIETVYSLDLSNENPDNVQIGIFIPEPSTYALLLGGIVLGYAFWRRRK